MITVKTGALMTATSAPEPRGLLAPLRIPNFRLLWIGIGTSALGDHFAYIALPWLALELTGDPFTVGLTRTMTGLAMAVFMLFGGALTDRLSPRRIMIASNASLCLICFVAAALLYADAFTVPLLLTLAFLFGAGAAFFDPAYYAVFPHLLEPEDIGPGNALMGLTFQLTGAIGPGLAGALIATVGVGAALAADGATFAVAVIALLLMRPITRKGPSTEADEPSEGTEASGLFADMRAGFAYVFTDPRLRVLALVIFAIGAVQSPTIGVGTTLLAGDRFGGSASAFGILIAGFGLGSVAGTAWAGSRYAPG
ncbi:MAG: MFS transporter [Chloroflexota bacterium]